MGVIYRKKFSVFTQTFFFSFLFLFFFISIFIRFFIRTKIMLVFSSRRHLSYSLQRSSLYNVFNGQHCSLGFSFHLFHRINKGKKNSKDTIPLRVELCKDKIDTSPLQIEMCKPKCYTCFLWHKAHMVVLYVDFEKLCRLENLFWIKILKQQANYTENLERFYKC